MRKITFLLILFVGLSNTYAVYAEQMKVKVGVYQNYPLMFHSNNGLPDGFGAEILRQIAEKEGWELEFEYGSWAEIFGKVKSGEIDITFPVAFTIDRTKFIQYNSQNVVSNWGEVYLRSGVKANSILDLEGKRVAVLEDDVYFTGKHGMQYLASAFNIKVEYIVVNSYKDVLASLDSGLADAGLVNRFFGITNAAKYNIDKSTILIHPVEVRFALAKESEKSFQIIEKLDPYVKEMKHQGNSAYNASYKKWIGGAEKRDYTEAIKIAFAALVIPALVIVGIFVIMRSEIRRKTKELRDKNNELHKEVDERRRVQEELRESQEKYSNLFNTSYNPVTIISEDGSIAEANGEMLGQFGYDKEDLLKMNLEMLVIKEHLHKVHDIISKMSKAKKWSFELDFVKSWGDIFNAEISASRLEISGRTFIQLVIMDVTSRKKASELLNRRQDYLEKKVEQEVQRRRQNERLMMQQSKMAAMGQMMSAIAHQWRQPLNTIAIYIQDFEDSFKHEELDEAYVAELVGLSMTQINFMSKTIDDFKNFFKPDKDEVVFDVCKETLSAIALLGVQLVKNNIKLTLNCHDSEYDFQGVKHFECDSTRCTYVKGFPNEYKQVLLNLVQNAKDAIEEAQDVKDLNGVIEVGVEEDADSVKVYILDNGLGIPDDFADRIFEPYFTTKEEGKGTGVGLYMSKIIIEQNMKGLLYFEKTRPGTKFIIELRKQPTPSEL